MFPGAGAPPTKQQQLLQTATHYLLKFRVWLANALVFLASLVRPKSSAKKHDGDEEATGVHSLASMWDTMHSGQVRCVVCVSLWVAARVSRVSVFLCLCVCVDFICVHLSLSGYVRVCVCASSSQF